MTFVFIFLIKGIEAAAYLSLENRCSSVTVINNTSVPFERSFGPAVGGRIQALLESKGVNFINDSTVVEVNGNDNKVTGVSCISLT